MLGVLDILFDIFVLYWWTITPFVLFFILYSTWIYYIRLRYASGLRWITLEIRLPQEVEKTPKAFEIVLSGIHGLAKNLNIVEANIQGMVPEWLSLEIIGSGGETHFLVRTFEKSRNLIEAKIHGEYPNAEIIEVEDYATHLPPDIPNKDYNLFGTEMILVKPDGYPIRTYEFFEAQVEEQRHDPLASLADGLSKLGDREHVWVQFVIQPTTDVAWQEDGKKLVGEIMGRKAEAKSPFALDALGGLIGIVGEIGEVLVSGKVGPKTPEKQATSFDSISSLRLSPGEREVVEAIEKNVAKLAYRTTIRFLYIAHNDVYNSINIASMFGFFRQFNTLNLNGFKVNKATIPSVDFLFPKQRNFWKKRRLFLNYKRRYLGPKVHILNTEELATLYHFPGRVVAAPMTPRIGAKKGEPPPGLPIG